MSRTSSTLRRGLAAAGASTIVMAGQLAASPAQAAPAWQPEAASYGSVEYDNLPITMRDGVVLRANVGVPTPVGASAPTPGAKFPVLVIQTPYRKDGGLFKVDSYFVTRGYAYVVVDVRGTGSSQGKWASFAPDEQADGPEIVRWAAHQSWANGRVGLIGASYGAINQLLTMEQPNAPSEVKAIFPVVPMSDAYRDVTFHGGNIDDAFMVPWLGLVTALGDLPGNQATTGNPADVQDGLNVFAEHLANPLNFQVPTALDAFLGTGVSYDGDFSRVRSPIEHIDRIHVPAFVVGGEFDIFQRGEPIIYNALNVPAKRLILGPWVHLEGSSASTLPADGIPDLKTLELQWYDQYVRGIETGVESAPRVLQYELKGTDASHFVASSTYPMRPLAPTNMYLEEGTSGSAHSLNDGVLGPAKPATAGSDALPFSPGTGCTRTTFQWGDASASQAGVSSIPCENDERVQELQELTYTTPVLAAPLTINGPVNVHLVAENPMGRNITFSVRLTDVAADGTATQITAGWLRASLRATSASPVTMWSGGKLLRAFHPYTAASESTPPAAATAYDIEVFPTLATFQAGHRLRLDIGTGDVPHSAAPVPVTADSLGTTFMIDRNPANPSYVTLPTMGAAAAAPAPQPVQVSQGPVQPPQLPDTAAVFAPGLWLLAATMGLLAAGFSSRRRARR